MQDLIGRRYVAIVGGGSLCLGIILLASAKHFAQGVVGMGFAGAGAAVGELTALAGFFSPVPLVSKLPADTTQSGRACACQETRRISRSRHRLHLAVLSLPAVRSVAEYIPHLALGHLDLLVSLSIWLGEVWAKMLEDLERPFPHRRYYSVLPQISTTNYRRSQIEVNQRDRLCGGGVEHHGTYTIVSSSTQKSATPANTQSAL